MKRFIAVGTLLLVAVLLSFEVSAQCAMCKAIVETNGNAAETGAANVSGGINNGILYLMGSVYSVLMILAYVFFKKPIQERLRANRAARA